MAAAAVGDTLGTVMNSARAAAAQAAQRKGRRFGAVSSRAAQVRKTRPA